MPSNDRQEDRVIVVSKEHQSIGFCFVLAMIDDVVTIVKYSHNITCLDDGLDWLGNKKDNVTASLFDPKKRLGRR